MLSICETLGSVLNTTNKSRWDCGEFAKFLLVLLDDQRRSCRAEWTLGDADAKGIFCPHGHARLRWAFKPGFQCSRPCGRYGCPDSAVS